MATESETRAHAEDQIIADYDSGVMRAAQRGFPDVVTLEIGARELNSLFAGGNHAGEPGVALALNALEHASGEIELIADAINSKACRESGSEDWGKLEWHCRHVAAQLSTAIALVQSVQDAKAHDNV